MNRVGEDGVDVSYITVPKPVPNGPRKAGRESHSIRASNRHALNGHGTIELNRLFAVPGPLICGHDYDFMPCLGLMVREGLHHGRGAAAFAGHAWDSMQDFHRRPGYLGALNQAPAPMHDMPLSRDALEALQAPSPFSSPDLANDEVDQRLVLPQASADGKPENNPSAGGSQTPGTSGREPS